MDENKRIALLIQAVLEKSYPSSKEQREGLAELLKDAAWARTIAAPILLLYADEKAYYYDLNATCIHWSKRLPMISEDSGKRARAALAKQPWASRRSISAEHWLQDVTRAERLLKGDKKHVRPVSGRSRGKEARGPV